MYIIIVDLTFKSHTISILYILGNKGKIRGHKGHNSDPISYPEDNALLSDLINEKNGDLKPDENLIEIWIKNAVIKPSVVPTGSSTFIVIDFFDYESQTTSLMTGNMPQYDFGASYKVIVDDFLLRYLAVETATLELNLVSQCVYMCVYKHVYILLCTCVLMHVLYAITQ